MKSQENFPAPVLEVQKRLFEEVKKLLPSKYSLANEIADLLNISEDSAYRRISCRSRLTIKDLFFICKGERATPFQFYLSEMVLENTFLVMKQDNRRNCMVKLFTIISLYDSYRTQMIQITPGRPGEFHPKSPTEPYLKVSLHTALLILMVSSA